MAGQSDPVGAIDCATVAIAIASDIRCECRVTVQVTAPGGQSSGYAAEDYTCPICLEILLRPIALSCGHRYCRSCWCRMLQGSTIRATAMSTGSVACPLGRCSVRPVVPEVEAALARDLLSARRTNLLAARPNAVQLQNNKSAEYGDVKAEQANLHTSILEQPLARAHTRYGAHRAPPGRAPTEIY